MRAELRTPRETAPRWLLEIAHASLDRVDVYFADGEGPFSHQRSGDRIPFDERPLPHRHHVFELPLKPASTAILYLRVASEGTLTVPTRLWQEVPDEDAPLRIGASIGVALYPDDGDETTALIRSADQAMYQRKRGGSPFPDAVSVP